MRFFKSILVILIPLVAGAPARADVFKWQDPQVGLSVTFPDEWRRTSAQQPDDIITILAPGTADQAMCRIRVNGDRRFVVYPREYAASIQRTAVSRGFWENYVGAYDGAVINDMRDEAGLGSGFASWADVTFNSTVPEGQKRGILFASNYGGRNFVFECSANHAAFDKWYPAFRSVLKSVEFKPAYAPRVNAGYRDFQNDGDLRIHGEKPLDLYIY